MGKGTYALLLRYAERETVETPAAPPSGLNTLVNLYQPCSKHLGT